MSNWSHVPVPGQEPRTAVRGAPQICPLHKLTRGRAVGRVPCDADADRVLSRDQPAVGLGDARHPLAYALFNSRLASGSACQKEGKLISSPPSRKVVLANGVL